MKEIQTQDLMTELTNRLIIDTKEDEILCPKCKGLRFILIQRGKHTYIENCNECYTGKVYQCKYCGKTSKTERCDCEDAKNERTLELQKKKEEIFEKAEKINYKDYNGFFLWNERAIDKEDLEEELYDIIHNGDEAPKYLYATKKDYVDIQVDIRYEIVNNASDGYEDMEDYLNMKSEKLSQAQKLIDEWVEEQAEATAIYYEDSKRVVLLDEIIDEIRKQIRENKN